MIPREIFFRRTLLIVTFFAAVAAGMQQPFSRGQPR